MQLTYAMKPLGTTTLYVRTPSELYTHQDDIHIYMVTLSPLYIEPGILS